MGVKFKIPSLSSELELTPLLVRGLDEPDDFQLVNAVDRRSAAGTLLQGNVGFQRIITVDLGIVKDKTSRTYLMDWMRAVDRQVQYLGDAVFVTPREAKGFSSTIKESKYFRRFRFELVERFARIATPISWLDFVHPWQNMGQTDCTPFTDTSYTFRDLP